MTDVSQVLTASIIRAMIKLHHRLLYLSLICHERLAHRSVDKDSKHLWIVGQFPPDYKANCSLLQWSATGVPRHIGAPLHGIRCAKNLYYKLYLNISIFTALNLSCHITLLNLKYLFPRFVLYLYAVGYKVYHHPSFLLISLRSIGCIHPSIHPSINPSIQWLYSPNSALASSFEVS
jgi:hypothetical protein